MKILNLEPEDFSRDAISIYRQIGEYIEIEDLDQLREIDKDRISILISRLRQILMISLN